MKSKAFARFGFFHRNKTVSNSENSFYMIVWKKFNESVLNRISLYFLILITGISIFGYLMIPDKTPYANRQKLEIALHKPGFQVNILKVKKNMEIQKPDILKKILFGREDDSEFYPFYTYKIEHDSVILETYTGLVPNEGEKIAFHIADVAFAIDANRQVQKKGEIFYFYDIEEKEHNISETELKKQVLRSNIQKRTFLLGTDKFGRDVLSQLIIGARISLSVGLISVLISLAIGIVVGAAGGYFGGKTDSIILWFINVIWAIPTLFLVIAITFALGKGFWQIFFAVGLTLWVDIARLVRGQIISVREKEFVEAARALGYSDFRIITRHIIPVIMAPVLVISASNLSSAILIESGLSFLGIGIQPPMPSWGTMLRDNYGYLIMDYAYLAIFPGIAIMLLVLTFMTIGNGLRDALEVRDIIKK